MSFNSKLTLVLEWYDERVTFSNLKTEDLTNLLGYQKSTEIWIPPLIFNNTKQNVMVALDPTASLFINKRGSPKMAPRSSVNEDFHYRGSENVFVYRVDYEMTYNCEFILFKYPFDTQTCQIEISYLKFSISEQYYKYLYVIHVRSFFYRFILFPYFCVDQGSGLYECIYATFYRRCVL